MHYESDGDATERDDQAWLMDKVFVTGASGFIGSRMTSALLKAGASLRVLSRRDQPGFETVVCDLQTDRVPDTALLGIDTVFHLAGCAHDLRDAAEIEHLYRAVNVDATVRLVELAALSGVRRFVFLSSVKAGGSALPGKCMAESDEGDPEGVYGQTKREAELHVLETGKRSGMHVAVVRSSLVYGAGVKGNLGEMLAAIRKGWFPSLPETGNRRSMIHVDDLVSALLMVAEREQANGEIFLATDGVDYSTREIYDVSRAAMGKRPTAMSIPKSLFTLAAWIGDRSGGKFPFTTFKMQKLLGDECYSSGKLQKLGFEPRYTLRNAVAEMVDACK